jgi:hypothetical protein
VCEATLAYPVVYLAVGVRRTARVARLPRRILAAGIVSRQHGRATAAVAADFNHSL